MFDVTLLPVMRREGVEVTDAFSYYVAEAPRRAARGRSGDRLILYFVLNGNAPLPMERQKQVLAHLASLFFKTPGSVTAALRTVATALNQHLLERNQHMSGSRRQSIGLLGQVVLRGTHLYLAYSGPITAFWSSSEEKGMVEDVEMLGKGLGVSRSVPVAFQHYDLKEGGALLLATEPSPTWSPSSLADLYQVNAEALRKKLIGTHAPNLNAFLIVARPGEGKYYLMRPKTDTTKPAEPAAPHSKEALPVEQPRVQMEGGGSTEPVSRAEVGDATAEGKMPHTVGATRPRAGDSSAVRFDTLLPHARRKRSSRPGVSPVEAFFTSIGEPIFHAMRKTALGVLILLEKVFPEATLGQIPTRWMMALAGIIPVIVVIISSLVYFQMGRSAQFQQYLAQAQKIAEDAAQQADLNVQRQEWRTVLDLIEQAEAYGTSSDAQHLKALAEGVLDQLDLVKRVNYQEAIEGGLPLSVRVRAMVAVKEEVYLLDENSGGVIRARKTARGSYEIDSTFVCAASAAQGFTPLVDIAPWPAGYDPQPEATIVAIDTLGHLLFCQPGASPMVKDVPPPVTAPWAKVVALSVDQGSVFVLDVSSGVWIFWARQFDQPPKFFFSGEVPHLEDAFDMMLASNELYLLHTDGHLTLCSLSLVEGVPSRCSEGEYLDSRPGYENQPMVIEPGFGQVVYVPPPDPSLLLVQPESHAVYHFSLRSLVYQAQYLPLFPLIDQPITAASVDAYSRLIFIALGNRVYYAVLP